MDTKICRCSGDTAEDGNRECDGGMLYWCGVCDRRVAEKRCPWCGLKARRIRQPASQGKREQ